MPWSSVEDEAEKLTFHWPLFAPDSSTTVGPVIAATGGAPGVKVTVVSLVSANQAESTTTSRTVHTPSLSQVCVTAGPCSDVTPSPKSQ